MPVARKLTALCAATAVLTQASFAQEGGVVDAAAPGGVAPLTAPAAEPAAQELTVRVSPDGLLTAAFLKVAPESGRRSAPEAVDVRLIKANRVVQQQTARINGLAQFDEVDPGIVTIEAVSPDGYFKGGLIVSGVAGGEGGSVPINAYLVSPTDYQAVGRFFDGTDLGSATAGDSVVLDNRPTQSSLEGPEVALPANGVATGLVVYLDGTTVAGLPGARVGLIRNGQVLDTRYTDPEGLFEFSGLRPGDYSIAAFHPQGFSVFGLKVEPAGTVRVDRDGKRHFVMAGGNPAIVTGIAAGGVPGGPGGGPGGPNAPFPPVPPVPPIAPGAAGVGPGGGLGGGIGGGAGGFGGGGLLPALVAGGIGGGLGYLAADDDDDDDDDDEPISPNNSQDEDD